VYDPVEKEVIIGATCTLTGPGRATKKTVVTDGFGDFWFEGLKEGIYSLRIKAKGFTAKSFEKLNTVQDINIGDIPLAKEV
jgi:hypothetical protein